MSKNRQDPDFRDIELPADKLERFSDHKRMLRFNGSCQFTLNRQARQGHASALVLDVPGQVRLVPESGAEILSGANDTLAGVGVATLSVTENDGGNSAKFVLGGDLQPYNDTTPWSIHASSGNIPWANTIWVPWLSLFIAGANGGSNRIMTSPDGAAWTGRAAQAHNIHDLCCSPTSVIVAGGGGIQRSVNGTAWADVFASAVTWFACCYNADRGEYLALGYDNTHSFVAMSTDDGLTWTETDINDQLDWNYFSPEGVVWAPTIGKYVMSGDAGIGTASSPTGTDWTARLTPGEGYGRISYSPELDLLVAAADYGSWIIHSTDAENWTRVNLDPSYVAFFAIVWAKELGLFIMLTSAYGAANNLAAISTDGKAWTQIELAEVQQAYGIGWSPELGMAAFASSNVDSANNYDVQTSHPL